LTRVCKRFLLTKRSQRFLPTTDNPASSLLSTWQLDGSINSRLATSFGLVDSNSIFSFTRSTSNHQITRRRSAPDGRRNSDSGTNVRSQTPQSWNNIRMLLIDKFMIACCLRDILHQRYEQNLRLQAQGSHHKGHTHFDLLFFMDLPFLHVKKHCDTTSFVYMNRNTCWSER